MAIQNSKLSLGHNPERSDTMSTDPQNITIMPHLMQKAHSKSDRVENLIDFYCRKTHVAWSVKIFVSAIVRNEKIPESVIEEVNQKICFIY